MKTDEIIFALRCTSSVPQIDHDCGKCPYHEAAMVDGLGEFEGCDVDQVALDAADRLEQLQHDLEQAMAKRTRRWISVEERLPKAFEPVIVCREGKESGSHVVEQGCKDVGDWWKVYGTRTKRVTHWMPLPKQPGKG